MPYDHHALLEADKRHIWHPFTQHKGAPNPIPIVRAHQATLVGADGAEYLDLISSWWTNIHGHNHPALNQAIINQVQTLDHVIFGGFTHPPAVALAAALTAALPNGLSRVFFSDNGSTAVEVALKMAYHACLHKTGRPHPKFLAFEGGYHGDTFGSMAVGQGSGFFKPYHPLLTDVTLLPYPATWQGDADIESKENSALEALTKALHQHQGTIAALIIEPLLQGAGGMRLCRPAFLKAVDALCKQADVLVIYDEVAVGFGRTGTLFACQQAGVVPDFICLSKGLTGGYLPMSVTVCSDAIFNLFLGDSFSQAFAHGHSFTANPLGCAVALASLQLFEIEHTLSKIAHIQGQHQAFINSIAHKVAKPRVLGSIMAFDMAGESAYQSTFSETLKAFYLQQGLNIRPLGNTVYLMPPYCITDAELARGYAGIIASLDVLHSALR
jgi:adenosylmethionine---8-amino-7-oxononanoate aminotransferase